MSNALQLLRTIQLMNTHEKRLLVFFPSLNSAYEPLRYSYCYMYPNSLGLLCCYQQVRLRN
jgi:hypothetical protein